MTAEDRWASYLDPDTHPDVKADIGSALDAREAEALDRVGGLLADEAVWGGPSGGLREQLLAQARAEQAAAADNDAASDGPDPLSSPAGPVDELAERRTRRGRLGRLGVGLVAAAAAVAALVIVARPLDDATVTTYDLAATPLTPDLDATADIESLPAGVAITLHIKGLPPAEEGTYYAAWLMPDMAMDGGDAMAGDMGDGDAMAGDMNDGDGMADVPMVGVGSFHWREGGVPIELWSGVDTDRFPVFIVTLQNIDDPPIASDVVVMTGRLTDG